MLPAYSRQSSSGGHGALSRLFDEGLIETFEGRAMSCLEAVPVRGDLWMPVSDFPASVVAPAAKPA